MKNAIFLFSLLAVSIIMLSGCTSTSDAEAQTKEENKSGQEKAIHTLPDFQRMEMPSITKTGRAPSNSITFDHAYSSVCWNDCVKDKPYTHPDMHAGNVEPGDTLQVSWQEIKPRPSEVSFLEIDPATGKELSEETRESSNTKLDIKIDKSMIGKQYAVEFVWKYGDDTQGRSTMDFRLE